MWASVGTGLDVVGQCLTGLGWCGPVLGQCWASVGPVLGQGWVHVGQFRDGVGQW